jgi:hypothetical protein
MKEHCFVYEMRKIKIKGNISPQNSFFLKNIRQFLGIKIQKAFTTFNLGFVISLVAFFKIVLLLFRLILFNTSWDGSQ